jgi:polyisoprenoid-binding protein YceI
MKFFIVFTLIFTIAESVYSTEYNVDKSKKNLVKFVSSATFQEFEGVTNNIDGYLFYKDNDFLSGSDLYFEVDLRTLDTGIGLRNRDMRENYLETDEYPFTQYKGKIIYVDKVSDAEYKVTTDGNLSIHGVTKPLKINGNLYPVEGGYRVKAYFEILLSDYNIEIPKLMFMKVSNSIKLVLDFYVKELDN